MYPLGLPADRAPRASVIVYAPTKVPAINERSTGRGSRKPAAPRVKATLATPFDTRHPQGNQHDRNLADMADLLAQEGDRHDRHNQRRDPARRLGPTSSVRILYDRCVSMLPIPRADKNDEDAI